MDFAAIIEGWYLENKRVLPWRGNPDAYAIWLSEVILQQTRVEQGLPYYERFIEKYPHVEDLANAPEEEVLKLWQGLGYYSRARNLHATAQFVVKELNAVFPSDYATLIRLKGIGDYSASAISSIVSNEAHAVVDGNVYRVLSRIFNIDIPIDSSEGKKKFKELASTLLNIKNPGLYNQALMEFGALFCVPKNPNCKACVFDIHCEARRKNKQDQLPVKANRTKTKDLFLHYLVPVDRKNYYLKKRNANSIWKNMYDFPCIENEKELKGKSFVRALNEIVENDEIQIQEISSEYTHQLSHRNIKAKFYVVSIDELKNKKSELKPVSRKSLPSFPIPKLIERYLVNKFKF